MSGKEGRSGRSDNRPRLKPAIAEAVLATIPLEFIATTRSTLPLPHGDPRGDGAQSLIVQSGLHQAVCWMAYAGLSGRQIAGRLGIGKDAVNRYLRSSHFVTLYDQMRSGMLAKTAEAATERLIEVTLEFIETKIDLARTTRDKGLQNKILTEVIQLGLEAARQGGAAGKSRLRAIWEKKQTTKDASGAETTVRLRVTGPPNPEFAANAAASCEDSTPFEESGEENRAPRPPKAEIGSGKDGPDSGEGDVRP